MSIYQPLNKESDEFRLLIIKPPSTAPGLECTLETLPLGNYSRHNEGYYDWIQGEAYEGIWEPSSNGENISWVPTYEALSYTWGNPKETELITVNGQVMDVTRNLSTALLALRKEDEDRTMWIDALCIDQTNIQERNEQIRRMPAIYQRATRTIAWIGESDSISLHAMDVMEHLGGTKAHMDTLESSGLEWFGPQFDPCIFVGGAIIDEGLLLRKLEHAKKQDLVRMEDLSEADVNALETLFHKRPYWKRLWVIQEIANSREVLFQCGSRLMGLETIECFMRLSKYRENLITPQFHSTIEEFDFRRSSLSSRFKVYKSIQYSLDLVEQRVKARHFGRSWGFEWRSSSLLNILEQFRGLECTDDRDRVYALLGLPSIDRNMPLPEPDYSKSVAEIYCETVKSIIRHTADLTILCLPRRHGTMNDTKFKHRIPFWVPDWFFPEDGDSYWYSEEGEGDDVNSTHAFCAAGETLPEGPDFSVAETSLPTRKRPGKPASGIMAKVEGGLSGRLLHRPRAIRSFSDPIHLLDLKGYVVDRAITMSDPIPETAFADDSWKDHVLKWEKMIYAFETFTLVDGKLTPYDPGVRHPQLGSFIHTISQGKILKSLANGNEALMETYVEHYLVWTKRISPEEARVPIQPTLLALFFEDMLKKNIRGWKFAITQEKRLASIPAETTEKDWIAIVFGCDYPLVVTHIGRTKIEGELEDAFGIVGPAFVPEIMRGEALEKAKSEGLEKVRFIFV